ncbi:hypothetical protein LUZ61_009077 [Rhynchospora tenuis]|uniref:NB-ARC domain-containing protein n=1 Tax=Rhynchospora tenuis TaxID=198213 RepID=A0AAD6EY00_9POAL|nr:hypothetical protein LUZ61_009077 [Rhynchospora tenuis]
MAARANPTSCEPEPPLVGFEDDKRKIMSALLDTSEPGFSVVHIIGPRGVGKTHLAKEIYTSPEVQKHFRVRIWVSASCSYYRVEDEDFKNMRAQLSIEHEADICRFLTGRRPENGRSSFPRTREFEVGPRSNEESLEILLNDAFSKYPWEDCPAGEVDDLSLEILLKTAFPKNLWEGCPASEVDDLVMKFMRKCKGLPWPLQFMGGLLSLCPWNELLDRIQTIEAAGMNFVDLAMRYRDLPSHEMRAAFLYFLTFPEDAEIHAESFALLLKSEGITSSTEQGKDILELLAESELKCERYSKSWHTKIHCEVGTVHGKEYVASMIEVTKWHSDGSIECCRLHDPLLRFLAIHEAKEKRFVSKNDSSILDLFDAQKELPSDRVLEIDDTINKVDVAREVKKRGELKHLSLNNLRLLPEIMKIKGWDKHLTTVVVGDTTMETLPSNELLKMRSVEHLSLRNTKIREIPELPESLKTLDVGELTSLTLENLEFDEDPMPKLGKLRMLKTLNLRWLLYSAQIKKMMCSNGSFPQLKRLQLYHISGLEEWSVEKRALPRVTHVVIDCCKALKDLSGPLVDRTTPLKELHLHAMPPGLTKKFSHLPFVKITQN